MQISIVFFFFQISIRVYKRVQELNMFDVCANADNGWVALLNNDIIGKIFSKLIDDKIGLCFYRSTW